MSKMTKAEWEELRWLAKRCKNVAKFSDKIAELGRTKTYANMHFGTAKNYSKKNLKKGVSFWVAHNNRTTKQEMSYILPKEQREPNEYMQFTISQKLIDFLKKQNLEPTKENYVKEYEKDIRADYKKHFKREMPYNAMPFKECVLNLEAHHTIKDILGALKEANFPLKVVDIAIHKDEGQENKLTGEVIKNYHAHILFLNYDYKTHRTILRNFSKAEFSKISKPIYKALKMEENPNKKAKKHLNRWQLDYKNEQKAKELLKELKAYEIDKEKELIEKAQKMLDLSKILFDERKKGANADFKLMDKIENEAKECNFHGLVGELNKNEYFAEKYDLKHCPTSIFYRIKDGKGEYQYLTEASIEGARKILEKRAQIELKNEPNLANLAQSNEKLQEKQKIAKNSPNLEKKAKKEMKI